jgi:predicted DNA-binding transcriptional regulator AlpA
VTPASKLDPRLYGIAPVERVVQDGVVYLTMAGVCNKLSISESTLRRMPALMAKRIPLRPRSFVWRMEDVDAYVEAQRPPVPDPATLKHPAVSTRKTSVWQAIRRAWPKAPPQEDG